MSTMLLPTIFWGIVFFIIISANVKKRNEESANNEMKRKAAQEEPMQYRRKSSADQSSLQRTEQRSKPAQTVTAGRSRSGAAGKRENKKPEEMSTTQYLQHKADLDTQEHARDDYETQKQILWETGGAGTGERLLEGDGIPAHKMCVRCRYCGADNLLPQGTGTKYTCYFCREFL